MCVQQALQKLSAPVCSTVHAHLGYPGGSLPRPHEAVERYGIQSIIADEWEMQAGAGHMGDRGQAAKAPALTALTPPTSSKALLGAPRGAGAAEGRSVAPVAIGARRNTAPEDVPVSSGPTPLTLSHSLPGGDKLGYAQHLLLSNVEEPSSHRMKTGRHATRQASLAAWYTATPWMLSGRCCWWPACISVIIQE